MADLIYGMAELHASSERSEDARSLSAQFIAAFDAMRQFHLEEAKRRMEGGVGSATADIRPEAESVTRSSVPPVSPRRKAKGPRCIENIPTTKQKVAHQCRNAAKYGEYCALHAVGRTVPDVEQFPAALVDQPDSLPWHD